MLRVEKIVYDAEYLEGLSRTQIQEHAKVRTIVFHLDTRNLTSPSAAWHQGE